MVVNNCFETFSFYNMHEHVESHVLKYIVDVKVLCSLHDGSHLFWILIGPEIAPHVIIGWHVGWHILHDFCHIDNRGVKVMFVYMKFRSP